MPIKMGFMMFFLPRELSELRVLRRAVGVILILMLCNLQNGQAHGTQVEYCFTNSNMVRIYIEHWHGPVTNFSSSLVNVTITVDGVPSTMNVPASGYVHSTPQNMLPDCSAPTIQLSECTNRSDLYDNWAYFDFPAPECYKTLVIRINSVTDPSYVLLECGAGNGGPIYPAQTPVLTIEDEFPPYIVCPDELGDIEIDCGADLPDPLEINVIAVSDDCSAKEDLVFEVSEITTGSNCAGPVVERTYSLTDEVGNTTTCVQVISTKLDIVKPTLFCPRDLLLECGDAANSGLITSWLASVSAIDDCGDAIITNNYDQNGFAVNENGPFDLDPNSISNLSFSAASLFAESMLLNSLFSNALYGQFCISGSEKNNGSDRQKLVTLEYEKGMTEDFSDLHFLNDDRTVIPYWIDEKVDREFANIWIKLPQVVEGSVSTITYFYGNDLKNQFVYADVFKDETSYHEALLVNSLNHGLDKDSLLFTYHVTDEYLTSVEDETNNFMLYTKIEADKFLSEKALSLYHKDTNIEIDCIMEKGDDGMIVSFSIPSMVYEDFIDIEFRNWKLEKERNVKFPEDKELKSNNALDACASPLTSTVNLNWSGGFCVVCGPGNNYACNVNPGSFPDWNGGNKTFTDPLPAGAIISNISVQVFGVGCGGGTTPVQVLINGSTLGTNNLAGTCACSSCFNTTVAQAYPTAGTPSFYNYGGVNTLNLSSTATVCVDRAVVTISYCLCPSFTISCPANLTIDCGDPGNTAAINTWLSGASATDPGATITNNYNPANLSNGCSTTGSQLVTFQGINDCNTETCTSRVTIRDITSPVAPVAPANINVQCADDVPSPIQLTAVDACDGNITVSPTEVKSLEICDNRFRLTRTWTFTDACGNSVSRQQILNVRDTQAPVAPVAPSNVTVQCADDVPTAINLTANDACDGSITVAPSQAVTAGSCPNDFSITRTWTFTDDCANSISRSQTITVNDTQAPVAPAAPSNVNVQCADDVPTVINLTAVDACDGNITVAPVEVKSAETCTNKFILTRTWTFTDDCGNSVSRSQIITVNDTQAPVAPAAPATVTVQCADDVPSVINLTAIDACDGNITVAPVEVKSAETCTNKFILTRTWTFTDDCGNSVSRSQTITVNDTQAPVAPAAPATVTVQCADDVPTAVNLTAVDACDGNITVAPVEVKSAETCTNKFILIRTWTFTDGCGNTISRTQEINVNDTQAPLAPIAPASISVQCADDLPGATDLTATDNCDGNITVSPIENIVAGSCPNNFTVTRTWTFADVCGNTTNRTQTITVNDTQSPILPTPPVNIELACGETPPAAVDLTATDNCDGAITVSPTEVNTPGACEESFTITRTWTFTDQCGNSSSLIQTISSGDADPMIDCPDELVLECGDPRNKELIDSWLENVMATDDCGDVIVTNNFDADGFASIDEAFEAKEMDNWSIRSYNSMITLGLVTPFYFKKKISGFFNRIGSWFNADDKKDLAVVEREINKGIKEDQTTANSLMACDCVAKQGAQEFNINAIQNAEDDVSFFSFGSPNGGSSNTGLEMNDAVVLYLYENTLTGEISLFIHIDDAGGGNGGRGSIDFFCLPLTATLDLSDDPGEITGVFSTVTANWRWANCCTDGALIGNVGCGSTFDFYPSFTSGITQMKWVSGTLAAPVYTTFNNFTDPIRISCGGSQPSCCPNENMVSITNVDCPDDNDGAIDVTVDPGSAPYTFNWSTGATTEDISGLEIGDYIVTITDDNDCEQISTYTVEANNQPSLICPSDVTIEIASNSVDIQIEDLGITVDNDCDLDYNLTCEGCGTYECDDPAPAIKLS